MLKNLPSPSIAVIGAGIAGSACAASLQREGMNVRLFDKSRGVGGRMATRRAEWTDAEGTPRTTEFDHGVQHFTARHPRFRAAVARAVAAGCVEAWRPQVHAAWPGPATQNSFVPVPAMPALCRHLLADVPLHMGEAVQRLERNTLGWRLVLAGGDVAGPFDQVMLAMPAAQAAALLAGFRDDWADALATVTMTPCWTLMAVTDDVDWPWDGAEPERGPLAWVARNDRKPGRESLPGYASWVAHAKPAWSVVHLEEDARTVADLLRAALTPVLAGGRPLNWHHANVHRWRYATLGGPAVDHGECWWDASLGLGVCGDVFGDGTIEAAWRSGDELADSVAADLDMAQGEPESTQDTTPLRRFS